MKITAFALLISGVFSSAIIPFAGATAEDRFSNHTQGRWSAPGSAPAYAYSQTRGMPESRPNGSPYRFRPLSKGDAHAAAVQAYPDRAQVAGVAPNAWQGYPGVGQGSRFSGQSPNRYRFRPVQNPPQQPSGASARVTYRPANLEIPNHYVYRPLNPVRRAQPQVYSRPQPPVLPQPQAYAYAPAYPTGFAPHYVNQPRPMRPPQPRARYVYGNDQSPGVRFRPVAPAHGVRFQERPSWSYPRYAANRWMDRPRFRPSPQFDRPHYRRPFPPGPESYYRYPPVSAYPAVADTWQPPAWGQFRGAYPGSYPAWYGAPGRFAGNSRYGVDWYDGRSDGEGAWYKLAEQQEWPRVSHNWPGE